MSAPRIAVGPERQQWVLDAVERGGGEVVDVDGADALVWLDAHGVEPLVEVLAAAPGLRWVQLPWAGVEDFASRGVLDDERRWTCGKGVYAEPVAEHALALLLGGLRHLARYGRASTWTRPAGRNLLGGRVTILGGGGIAEALLRLLGPFGVSATVVRRSGRPLEGAARTVTPDALHDALTDADGVVLALALTPETRGVIDAAALGAMPGHAWLVNVARGAHVVTGDLVAALEQGTIGGAGLDVTDPEPLPDDHPLWRLANCVITPHTANTPEMARVLLAVRIEENVRRFAAGRPLLGPVDAAAGY